MKILYLTPESLRKRTSDLLRQHGHKVVSVNACLDALELIRNQRFDAVVMEEENPDPPDFTVRVHRIEPTLPVFLASDWGPTELPMAMESIVNLRGVGEVLHR
ncbi:MAG: hypothetical protein WCF22_21205 [Candidatus Sulfotelmatobacter sp.]